MRDDSGGITIIDTGYVRPALCAAYLVRSEGRAALIDCGTATCAPRVLAAIDAAGVDRASIDWVMVTHVHLDHAGGAGPLMRALPSARLVVHPRGAPHMIDPTRLIAGAKAVYGEADFARDHAGMLPVPESRVVIADDGHVVDLAGRALVCVDTPGHARHHYSVWDAATRSWFAGDTFGISYRELDTERGAFVIPTSSPVQFDPGAMKDSVCRILAEAPARVYLTHYGEVTDCQQLGSDLIAQVDEMAALARALARDPDRHGHLVEALTRLYVKRAQRHGVTDAASRVPRLLAMDIELNAQGLGDWLRRDAC
ncbi:MBL fold metallo-hydrolase [Luteimonas sp. TWI662]|uniref:MBL fold metallo-hydrolase n=1 Tax=Luteimonas sp. TWI662 TaxID=3136789 RepID=UPI00320BA72C